MLSSALLLGIPAAPRSHPEAVIVVTGIFGTILGFFANVNQLTLRQSITPQRLQGRMNSVVRFMYWGTIPLGSAIGGLLADPLGLRKTLFYAGICGTIACIPIAASPIRKLRSLSEPSPERATSVKPLIRATVEVDA
jgi:predicted MFS family arabinose efflux permease